MLNSRRFCLKKHTCPRSSISCNRGFSLIEILVTAALLAIGLMGLAALQVTGLTNNHSTQLRGQLVSLSNDIVERMRANPLAARSADNNQNYTLAKTNDSTTVTKAVPVTQSDLQIWVAEVVRVLPNAFATIQVTPQNVTTGMVVESFRTLVTITLEFDDTRSLEFKQLGGRPSRFVISSWI